MREGTPRNQGGVNGRVFLLPADGRGSDKVWTALVANGGERLLMGSRLEDSEWGFFLAVVYYPAILIAIPLSAYFLVDPVTAYALPIAAPIIGTQTVRWATIALIGVPSALLFKIIADRWDRLVRGVDRNSS
jgi:hypothetical protein